MNRYATLFFGLAVFMPVTALAQGLPHTFSPGTPARADEVNANFRYVAPENIVYVSPTPGSTPTENGAAFRAALVPANLTAINGAPSASNRYLIQLAPGVYDIGADQLFLRAYVDVRGVGPSTVIRGQSDLIGVVRMGTSMTLSSLRIEATGGGCVALYAGLTTGIRIADVDVRVNGASQYGIGIDLDRVTAEIDRVTIEVSGSDRETMGLRIDESEVTAHNVRILVQHDSTTRGAAALRLFNDVVLEGSDLHLTAMNATAPGARSYALSVSHTNNVRLRNSILEVTGGNTTSFPIFTDGASSVIDVHHSVLRNHSASRFASTSQSSTVRVGASQIVPQGSWTGAGTAVCAHVYDGDFVERTCSNLQ